MEGKPNSLRPHIVLCGEVNAGKSSLMNALTGQNASIVSKTAGTTTDAVSKAMELLPFGPVVFTDTAGLNDNTELGAQRIAKTAAALAGAEVMIAVADIRYPLPEFPKTEAAIVFALTHCDEISDEECRSRCRELAFRRPDAAGIAAVSSKTGAGIEQLKQILVTVLSEKKKEEPELMEGLTAVNRIFVLVCPIDTEAPAGRLILPQVQTIRKILDTQGIAVTVQPQQLPHTLELFGNLIDLVITDSQAVDFCSQTVPPSIRLTTFSILFSAWRGDIATYIRNAAVLDTIGDDDLILIAEACTHQVHCDDIGRVQLPALIRKYTGKNPHIDVAGGDYPDDVSKYKLIIHCGGCMMTAARMRFRTKEALAVGVPITNYGVAISHMQGVLNRVSEIFRNEGVDGAI